MRSKGPAGVYLFRRGVGKNARAARSNLSKAPLARRRACLRRNSILPCAGTALHVADELLSSGGDDD